MRGLSSLTRPSRLVLAAACLMGVVTAEASGMFTISSSAYKDQTPMDARFTCEGASLSPPLKWNGAPAGTKSYALIIDDPDAPDPAKPEHTFVHWVIYDIPAAVSSLAENATKKLPDGARQGSNDRGDPGYTGPCPPIGRHRYFHKLYALDVVLPDLHNPNKAQLEAAMKGHVLAETQLIGTYQKH
jgi:Raf kinase inhibitor-like YbhB/YbcL family protein